MSKHILLLNDLPGFGKVALAAMVPILSKLGHYTYQLPTAVISNTLDYGTFHIQDMTDYMKNTMKVWDELGFDPDCICTGFILSMEQVSLIQNYIDSRDTKKHRFVMVDPIMGDGGKLYNSVGLDRVNAMRELASYSDVMVPNITEATFLAELYEGQEEVSKEQIREIIDCLRKISNKSIVITSVREKESKQHFVCGYDDKLDMYFYVPYEQLPVRVAGSGDTFSSIMLGGILGGKSLKESVENAVKTLDILIRKNERDNKGFKGIALEQYMEEI